MDIDKTLIKNLVTRPDPVILDVGTHYAEDSRHFMNMWPLCHLYMFEPDKRCISIIKATKIAGKLFEGVMSDVDGEVDFYPSGKNGSPWDGSGSVLTPTGHLSIFPGIDFDVPYTVKSITLDTFVKTEKLDVIDLIWADVQGAEARMIMGGLDVFHYKVKLFFTEYENTELYRSAPSKERILDLLQTYEMVKDVSTGGCCGDMLLKNKKFYGG